MSQLERLAALNGEDLTQLHGDEINQIMQEMNLQEAATSDVNDFLKKAATATFSVTAGDWVSLGSGFYNRQAFKSLQHGLGYTPIAFGYVLIHGTLYQLPFNDYTVADGIYQGAIDLLPYTDHVQIAANYNNVTPDFTAYVFVTTATGANSTAS